MEAAMYFITALEHGEAHAIASPLALNALASCNFVDGSSTNCNFVDDSSTNCKLPQAPQGICLDATFFETHPTAKAMLFILYSGALSDGTTAGVATAGVHNTFTLDADGNLAECCFKHNGVDLVWSQNGNHAFLLTKAEVDAFAFGGPEPERFFSTLKTKECV